MTDHSEKESRIRYVARKHTEYRTLNLDINSSCFHFIFFLFAGEQSEERVPRVREALSPTTDEIGRVSLLEPATLPTKYMSFSLPYVRCKFRVTIAIIVFYKRGPFLEAHSADTTGLIEIILRTHTSPPPWRGSFQTYIPCLRRV